MSADPFRLRRIKQRPKLIDESSLQQPIHDWALLEIANAEEQLLQEYEAMQAAEEEWWDAEDQDADWQQQQLERWK